MLKGDKCKSLKAETKQKTKHKESESSVSSSDDSDSEQYHRKKKKVVLSKMKPKEIVKRKKKSFRHSSESDSSAESDQMISYTKMDPMFEQYDICIQAMNLFYIDCHKEEQECYAYSAKYDLYTMICIPWY